MYSPLDFLRDAFNPWTGYVRVFQESDHPTPREVVIAQTLAGGTFFGLAWLTVDPIIAGIAGVATLYIVAATAESARNDKEKQS